MTGFSRFGRGHHVPLPFTSVVIPDPDPDPGPSDPPADNRPDAPPIILTPTPAPGSDPGTNTSTGTTTGGTADPGGDSNDDTGSSTRIVWYKFTAPVTGELTIIQQPPYDAVNPLYISLYLIPGDVWDDRENVTYSSGGDGYGAEIYETVFANLTYWISVSDTNAPTDFELVWTFTPGVANDDLANAEEIDVATDGEVVGNNENSFMEAGEDATLTWPGSEHTVWYKFTAPATERIAFMLDNGALSNGSPIVDTYYDGSTIADIDLLQRNEASTDGFVWALDVVEGTEYFMRVSGGEVEFTLLWFRVVNDFLANAISFDATGAGSLTGDATGSTWEDQELVYGLGYPHDGTFQHSVWYTFDGDLSIDPMVIDTLGDGPDTSIVVFKGGPLIGDLEVVASNNNSEEMGDDFSRARVSFEMEAATTYYVRVNVGTVTGGPSFPLNWTAINPIPPDPAIGATPIDLESTGDVDGTFTGAPDSLYTTDDWDSSFSYSTFGDDGYPRTRWYVFTPTDNGSVDFTPNGDLIGMIFVGEAGSSDRPNTPDMYGTSFFDYRFFFYAGWTYWIMVADTDPVDGGAFTLAWTYYTPPANDNMANATVIDVEVPDDVAGTLVGSTHEWDPVGNGVETDFIWGNNGSAMVSVWYTFTPVDDVTVRFTIDGPADEYNLDVGEGDGTPYGSSLVGGNGGGSPPAEHQVDLLGGTQYWLRVSDNSDGDFDEVWGHTFTLEWLQPVAPGNLSAPVASKAGAPYASQLSSTGGVWNGTPTPTFDYQWKFTVGGANLPGVSNLSTYDPQVADAAALNGKSVYCQVTATNDMGSASADSNAVTITALAPSATLVQSVNAAASAASVAFTSRTPTANALQLCVVHVARGSSTEPVAPSVAGNGLTWVLVRSHTYRTGISRAAVYVFRAMGAAPSAGVATVTLSASNDKTATAQLIEVTNVATGGTNGSAAVVQSSNNGLADTSTTPTATLAAFADVDNATIGFIGHYLPAATITAGSGFTLLGEATSTNTETATEFKAANDTTVDFTLSSNPNFASVIGLELSAL